MRNGVRNKFTYITLLQKLVGVIDHILNSPMVNKPQAEIHQLEACSPSFQGKIKLRLII